MMKLFGVLNTSLDSAQKDSVVKTPEEALKRARWLLANGADYFDIGGQASTDTASLISPLTEWERLKEVIPALTTLGRQISIDTWKPEVARKALDAGATIINAADGLQNDAMLQLAAERECLVVLPFMWGPDPLNLKPIQGDPLTVMLGWFKKAIYRAQQFGVHKKKLILDPGTGFSPFVLSFEARDEIRKKIYQNLQLLKCFDLPLYVALPRLESPKHEELLEIILSQQIEYGRCHDPHDVRAKEKVLAPNQI